MVESEMKYMAERKKYLENEEDNRRRREIANCKWKARNFSGQREEKFKGAKIKNQTSTPFKWRHDSTVTGGS